MHDLFERSQDSRLRNERTIHLLETISEYAAIVTRAGAGCLDCAGASKEVQPLFGVFNELG